MISTTTEKGNNNNNKNQLLLITKDFISGYLAKLSVQTINAPYNTALIKIPYQENYNGLIDFYIRYTKKNGILSLWKNDLKFINYPWNGPKVALNFTFKDYFKKVLIVDDYYSRGEQQHHKLKLFFGNFIYGGMAGFSTSLILHPIEMKIREMKNNGSSSINKNGISASSSIYKGFGISSLYSSVYCSLLFGGYDTVKYYYLSDNSSFFKSWLIAQSITNLAVFLSYPLDTVRRRMLMQVGSDRIYYTSSLDCIKKIITKEGMIIPFFKGSFNTSFGITSGLLLVFYDKFQNLIK